VAAMAYLKLEKKYNRWGWFFVAPAALLIFGLSFFPMIQAFYISLHSGIGNNLRFTGLQNYARLTIDPDFLVAVGNVLIYLVIEVPIQLFLALVLAAILNGDNLKIKGTFRTMVFLPCATSLVAAAIIFKTFFSLDGIINFMLLKTHIVATPISFLTHPFWAKIIIITACIWRWTGYNTIFYLAGMQNIDSSVYEAARIDGASPVQSFFRITIPLLKPVILLTTIMSTNGTMQMFDEPWNITQGGPGSATETISLRIYKLSFVYNPQFGYAAAVSYMILLMVAVLSLIQIKISGDRAPS
jgi:lactose/L-arabinose transport system permease protein